jgi:AraC family transcriptional regulator of adaptative response / DNA-3-methyladenine glycosylase II
VGGRQLRRLFLQHIGASPISVAQARRVLFAKQLIHDTDMPMADIAAAAGFGSLRRFNETFLDLFHRPPRALRRRKVAEEQARNVVLRLRYRPPYNWENMLEFLQARAIPGMEIVEDGRYLRTVEMDGSLGSISVAHLPREKSLEISILFPDVRALPAIVARARRVFDLGADIETIEQHLAADPALAGLIAQRPGLRAPGGWDGFEVGIRAVLGQQVSVAAARQLAGRLVELRGRCVPKPFRNHRLLSLAFPDASRLVSASSIKLAMPGARLLALMEVARSTLADPNLFHPLGGLAETVARLKSIPGIGEWSAQYIALRAVRESDAFPATDLGLLRGAASIGGVAVNPAGLLDRAEGWRPWRAYAAQHLWAVSGNTARNHSSAPA